MSVDLRDVQVFAAVQMKVELVNKLLRTPSIDCYGVGLILIKRETTAEPKEVRLHRFTSCNLSQFDFPSSCKEDVRTNCQKRKTEAYIINR